VLRGGAISCKNPRAVYCVATPLPRNEKLVAPLRQPVQPHTYARLLVFNETLAQRDFAVVTCSDVVMSVLYSLGVLIVYIQCNDTQNTESVCRRICIMCQQTSPKRWFGNLNITSNCDVTNSAHQMQITTTCHCMKSFSGGSW